MLRDYQATALTRLRQSLARGNLRPMVQAPTGAGKTRLATAIVTGALAKGKRVIFCVPAIDLIDQTAETFWSQGIRDIGVMQGNHAMTDPSRPVQIASMQTLMRRSVPPADLVIIDEAHRWFDFTGRWMQDWATVPFIGLSATPWTKGLGKHYDDLIVVTTTADLIQRGYLSPFRVYAPPAPDLSKCRTVAGDYHEGDLSEAMDQQAITADVVSTWLKLGEDRPTLCFAVDRAHAQHLAERFNAAGISTGYIDAFTTREERQAVRKQFQSGAIRVVCNVGCLTTGVDWDVRCIVLARPTKSEILFTQIIGRGLRTADGKDDCIARDSLVLTDKGEVKIQDVTLDHKVWDGVEFVQHSGAICRGVRQVVEYDGLVATPDHEVMTNDGWKTIAEAAGRQLRIARTGFGGKPIRYTGDCISENGREQRPAQSGSEVQTLRGNTYGVVSQHSEAAKNKRLPALQWATACHRSEMVISAMSVAARSMQQSAINLICSLWRSWHTVSLFVAQRGGAVDFRESWYSGSLNGNRPDRQQWALRTRQSPLVASGGKHGEYSEVSRGKRKVYCVSEELSGGSVCGQNASQAHWFWHDRQANHSEMEYSVVQTKREVWDILNAGPLQRFTANGRLVHNCLILDHTSTHERLGFVTDIQHSELDTGKHAKAGTAPKKPDERLPKACPSCTYLKPVGVHACPACGFAPQKSTAIVESDGDLHELTKGQKTRANKQAFFSALITYAQDRGIRHGWVAHTYREYFGVWPQTLNHTPGPMIPECGNFIKHKQIAFAKRRSAA